MSKIYRYISFHSFVDTIQRRKLTFIHPSLWDDPFELYFLQQEIKSQIIKSNGNFSDALGAILQYIVSNKTYAQAWTSLNESDSLWRIYSHGGTSVRISTDRNKISLLDDVKIFDVKYVKRYKPTITNNKDFIELIGTKREAFSHEKEVRLVKYNKFSDMDDANKHITAFLALNGMDKYFDNIEIENIKEKVEELVKKINQNIQTKIQYIRFETVDNFIESVMLNPFAPDWFDDTLQFFCKKNNLKYLGRSKLYKR